MNIYKETLLYWIVSAVIATTALCVRVGHTNGWEHTAISLDALIRALADSNASLRIRAAQSLGFRKQPESVAALLKHLEGDEPVPEVRQEIFHSLGEMASPDATGPISHCVDNESAPKIRATCIYALGKLGDPDTEDVVVASLDDPADVVRFAAVKSLGGFSSSRIVRILKGLVNEQKSGVADAALASLGYTRSAEAMPILIDAFLLSDSPAWTIQVLNALTILQQPDTTETIQRIYQQSNDATIKRFALVAMAATNAKSSHQYFLDALSSQDPITKTQGLLVLRQSGNTDRVANITNHASRDLGDFLSAESDILMTSPGDTLLSLELLNEYLKTIVTLDPSQGMSLFEKAATPRDLAKNSATNLKIAEGFYQARWQSIYGLGYVKSDKAGKLIVSAINDPDHRIRAVATRSLGVLENPAYLKLIQTNLSDEAAEVRWTAARVLGRLKDQGSVKPLLTALQDTDTIVRMESAFSLGYLQAIEAIETLTQVAANDPDNRTREAATYALSLIR